MNNAPRAWAPGARVGELRIEAEIGRGGMGVVFRACDVRNGRGYALKTVSADASPQNLERFRREAEAQARVDRHPNVLRIHSAGEHAGRLYFVMDLARGGDLKQRLRRERVLPFEEAARIGVALARGLAHAHAHGVLHRDLKPGNVMFDDDGTPQIVDFGVARLLDSQSSLTRTGDMVGTLYYMAPEQLDDGKRVDERSDVYSLGALLYACLTGVPPLDGGSQVATMRAVLEDEPRPLSALREDVPPALEAVCHRALSKTPEERYPSAEAFAQALEAALRPAPVPRGSRRWGLAVLMIGAGAGLIGVTAWSLSAQRPSSGPGTPAPVVSSLSAEDSPEVSPPAETRLWAVEAGDVLAFRFAWEEENYAGTQVALAGRLILEFSGEGLTKVVTARCVVESLATSSERTRKVVARAPAETLELTDGGVAFVGALDTLSGGLDSRAGPGELRERILASPPLQIGLGSDFDVLTTVRFCLGRFFRESTLARLLRLLFDVDERGRGFAWARGADGSYRAERVLVAAPVVDQLSGFSIEGPIKHRASGTLRVDASGPLALEFEQVQQRGGEEPQRATLKLTFTRERATRRGS